MMKTVNQQESKLFTVYLESLEDYCSLSPLPISYLLLMCTCTNIYLVAMAIGAIITHWIVECSTT